MADAPLEQRSDPSGGRPQQSQPQIHPSDISSAASDQNIQNSNLIRGTSISLRAISRRPRGRGRGRGRGRNSNRVDSSENSDDEFSPFGPQRIDSTRFVTRSRRANSFYTTTSTTNDSGNSDSSEMAEPVDGPPIDSILSKVTNDTVSSFIVKWKDKSFIHCSTVPEDELRTGTITHPILTKFLNSCEAAGEIASNLGPNNYDPLINRVEISTFCVERIIFHRYVNRDETFDPEVLDKSHYIPGLPTDAFPPSEHVLKYENPIFYEETTSDVFANDMGELVLARDETNGHQPSSYQLNSPSSIPEGVEFYVKWEGMPESSSSWDTMKSLFGSESAKFCCANRTHLKFMISTYWARATSNSLPYQPRNISLSEGQSSLVRFLQSKRESRAVSYVTGGLGYGRRSAVISFIESIVQSDRYRRPSLIVTEETYIEAWTSIVRLLTRLVYVVYGASLENRMIIRQYEVSSSLIQKFDVMVTTPDLLSKEPEFFRKIGFVCAVYDCAATPTESDAFTIVLANTSASPLTFSFPEVRPNYSETVVFAEDLLASTIHQRLREALKNKNTRPITLRNIQQLFFELVNDYIHPFLLPQMEKSLIQENRTKKGDIDKAAVAVSVSGKLSVLLESIPISEVTAVVASSLATLRIISIALASRSIPFAFLNSMNVAEAFPDSFRSGVILMTRDFSSPILETLTISSVYFFDIGNSFEADQSLARFFRRSSEIPVFRLLYDSSMEREMYLNYLTVQGYDYRNVTAQEAELYVRAATFLTQPSQKTQKRTIELLSLPSDSANLLTRIGTVIQEIRAPDFWETFFSYAHFAGGNRQIQMKKSDVTNFIDNFMIRGFGEWAALASDLGRSVEETTDFGRAIMLNFVASLDRNGLATYGLTSQILWTELFNVSLKEELNEDSKYWQNAAINYPILSSPLFTEPKFTKIILARREHCFKCLERNWIIKAFLSLHTEPYIPLRFCVKQNDPLTSPQYFYSILRAVIQYGERWSIIAEKLSPRATEQNHQEAFAKVFNSVHIDLLSTMYHQIAANNIQSLQIKYLIPLLQRCMFGPFCPSWTDDEVKGVMHSLSDFLFPFLRENDKDLLEFHSLTLITTKSREMMKEFVHRFVGELMKGQSQNQVVLGPEILHTDAKKSAGSVLSKVSVEAFQNQVRVLHHVRVLAVRGIEFFQTNAGMPPGWDKSCDLAMVKGICQYGLGRLDSILNAVPQPIEGVVYDHHMERSLNEFSTFSPTAQELLKRLRFVILCNRPIVRHLHPWNGCLRKVIADYPQNANQKKEDDKGKKKTKDEKPEEPLKVPSTNPQKAIMERLQKCISKVDPMRKKVGTGEKAERKIESQQKNEQKNEQKKQKPFLSEDADERAREAASEMNEDERQLFYQLSLPMRTRLLSLMADGDQQKDEALVTNIGGGYMFME